jgi:3-hydroxy-5-phosphonooxypentane-2,4-dione thiolase
MADKDDIREGKDFGIGIPQKNTAFYLKGGGALDWGMQNRLARIFNPASGRTVMLAFDHGYFQGPTSGLERIDLNIAPLAPLADALMLTRGALRTSIPPTHTGAVGCGRAAGRRSSRSSRTSGSRSTSRTRRG